MEDFSDRFGLLLRDSHETVAKVEVLVGASQEPVNITNYFTDGLIEVARQEIRRYGAITFIDRGDGTQIVPTGPDSLLAPYGNELRVWSGMVFPDKTEEYVPVGTLRITKIVAKYPYVTVTLNDRAWIVQGAALEDSYTIPAGTNYSEAIQALLVAAYPQATYDIPVVSDATPLIVIDAFEDPWKHLQDMAVAVGHQLFFTPMGVCVMRPEQDFVDLDPVWTYDGKPNANIPYDPNDWANLALYDQEHTWDTEGVFNAVVAIGENASNSVPARGIAYDTDPTSPTLYGGRFGKRLTPVSNSLLTSNGQAEVFARTTLQGMVGLAESLTIPAIPHPALECDDSIKVIRPELGINTIHQIDHLTVPLRRGTQTIDTRLRRSVLGQ